MALSYKIARFPSIRGGWVDGPPAVSTMTSMWSGLKLRNPKPSERRALNQAAASTLTEFKVCSPNPRLLDAGPAAARLGHGG
jgi:hypothetical protein